MDCENKLCRKCGELKPKKSFSKRTKSIDGLSSKCKKCSSEYNDSYRKENKEKCREATNAWVSENTERIRVYRRNYMANRRKSNKKQRDYEIEYRVRNKEEISKRVSVWASKNKDSKRISESKRRAKKLESTGSLSKGIISNLLVLQKGKCACCGAPLGNNYHLDHRIPLALGGANEDSNMQLLTASCNLKKGRKDPVAFMQERGFLL